MNLGGHQSRTAWGSRCVCTGNDELPPRVLDEIKLVRSESILLDPIDLVTAVRRDLICLCQMPNSSKDLPKNVGPWFFVSRFCGFRAHVRDYIWERLRVAAGELHRKLMPCALILSDSGTGKYSSGNEAENTRGYRPTHRSDPVGGASQPFFA